MAGNTYVCKVTDAQLKALETLLRERGWEFGTCEYAHWRAKTDGVQVTAYTSGKLMVQGRQYAEFVQLTLETEILHEARFGYDAVLAKQSDPKMFEPHAGIDESGKGDFFGPMVVACVYTDENSAKTLLEAGVADSKTITTDRQIRTLAELIRKETAGRYSVVVIGPEAYNGMYERIGNLNRLLAWGHAQALENLLEKVADCPRALSDQFAKGDSTLRRALKERGQKIVFEQHPKAEADIAVAAASILAREMFINRLAKLGEDVGVTLPRGVNPAVKAAAQAIVEKHGRDMLPKVCKMHFKTAGEV